MCQNPIPCYTCHEFLPLAQPIHKIISEGSVFENWSLKRWNRVPDCCTVLEQCLGAISKRKPDVTCSLLNPTRDSDWAHVAPVQARPFLPTSGVWWNSWQSRPSACARSFRYNCHTDVEFRPFIALLSIPFTSSVGGVGSRAQHKAQTGALTSG